MINLVLDTSIYRKNPSRTNQNFEALKRLSKGNVLKLHIPYIVQREFQTHLASEIEKQVKEVEKGFNGLTRKEFTSDLKIKLDSVINEFREIKSQLISEGENQFIQWGTELGAEFHPLCLDQAVSSLEAYFTGLPPFKQPEERKDIPDGFIVQAINKIQQEFGNLTVVAGDNRLREAFSGNDQIQTCQDLEKFIESGSIQSELKDLDLIDRFEEIKGLVKNFEESTFELSSALKCKVGESVVNGVITDKEYSYDEYYNDENERTINGYGDPESIEFDFSNMVYYGDSKYGVPFIAELDVYAYFYIYKNDYHADGHTCSVTELNDHYYEAEDEFTVKASGTASFTIEAGLLDDSEQPEQYILSESIEVDTIESIIDSN